jgi:hypothetical protein
MNLRKYQNRRDIIQVDGGDRQLLIGKVTEIISVEARNGCDEAALTTYMKKIARETGLVVKAEYRNKVFTAKSQS